MVIGSSLAARRASSSSIRTGCSSGLRDRKRKGPLFFPAGLFSVTGLKTGFACSTACADFAACGAEIAAVLADHRVRTACLTLPAEHRRRRAQCDGFGRRVVSVALAALVVQKRGFVYRTGHMSARQPREQTRRHLIAFGVEKTATMQNLLDRISQRSDFRVVPAWRMVSVEPLHFTEPNLPAVPRHLAQILQITRDKAAARGERQRAHRGRDPLLRLVALPGRNEEFDRPFDRDLLAADAPFDLDERDRKIQRFLAGLLPLFALFHASAPSPPHT